MKIKTSYELTPMPNRNFDWCAVDDDTYDGEGCPCGWGATEEDAISDLMEQIEMMEDKAQSEVDFRFHERQDYNRRT